MAPNMTVSLAIIRSTFSMDDEVTLNVTATSHAPGPITLMTYNTILNVYFAQRAGRFTHTDVETGEMRVVQTKKCTKRVPYNRAQGGFDDQYFLTLLPEQAVEICEPFLAAKLNDKLVPGNKYWLGVKKDRPQVGHWWKGTREEVMAPEGKFAGLCKASGKPIIFQVEPVEFEVIGKDKATGEDGSS